MAKQRLKIGTAQPDPASGCRPATPFPPTPDWDRFAAGFLDRYFQADPPFAVYQGRHEFDGALPDWSEAGLKAWIDRLHQLQDSASAFPIPAADSSRRFEHDYLIAQIDRDLFWRERADWAHRTIPRPISVYSPMRSCATCGTCPRSGCIREE